jgi:hypothetical protein
MHGERQAGQAQSRQVGQVQEYRQDMHEERQAGQAQRGRWDRYRNTGRTCTRRDSWGQAQSVHVGQVQEIQVGRE